MTIQGPPPTHQQADSTSVQRRSLFVKPLKAALVRARSTRWSLLSRDQTRVTGLRILFYHRISDERDDFAVSRARFLQQMDFLTAESYQVLGVTEAFDLLAAGNLPERTIALNFDDGYRDVAEHALPVLAERGFRATVFIVTGAADETVSFHWYRRQPPLLTWTDIVELDGQGQLRFEAHSATHANLTALPTEVARAEIVDSKRTLENRLGRPVEAFCYPGGFVGPRERKLVADAGFRLAVSCEQGINRADADRFALSRQQIDPRDSLLDFRAKLGGGHDSPLPLQGLYRRWRYFTEARPRPSPRR